MTADLAQQPITTSNQIGLPSIIITVIGILQIITIIIGDVSPVINLDIWHLNVLNDLATKIIPPIGTQQIITNQLAQILDKIIIEING